MLLCLTIAMTESLHNNPLCTQDLERRNKLGPGRDVGGIDTGARIPWRPNTAHQVCMISACVSSFSWILRAPFCLHDTSLQLSGVVSICPHRSSTRTLSALPSLVKTLPWTAPTSHASGPTHTRSYAKLHSSRYAGA